MIRMVVWMTVASALFLDGAQGSGPEKVYFDPGPHDVGKLEYRSQLDSSRMDRSVPIKVHYPRSGVEAGPFPLVVVSHGEGGTYDSHEIQAAHLASHGYVVFCIEHVLSNNWRIVHYMKPAGGMKRFEEAIHQVTRDRDSFLERPLDVGFAIDQAFFFNRNEGALKGKIDVRKVGVIGHSYGAYTALVACGARPIMNFVEPRGVQSKGLAEKDLSEPRITFGLAMSPPGSGTTFFNNESFKSVNRPFVCVSGTKDRMLGMYGDWKPAESRLRMFDLLAEGNKTFLWLENARHIDFLDQRNGWIERHSEARPDTLRIVKAVMVIGCDAFLKDLPDAKAKLGEEYFRALAGEGVPKVEWFSR